MAGFPQKKARHQSPAGTPETIIADQLEWLVLPESSRPCHEKIGQRGRGADLDQLGTGPHFAQREHPRRRPSHHDQKVRISVPSAIAGQDRQAERDHHREALVISDRHDHPGDRHRDHLGVPGLRRRGCGPRPAPGSPARKSSRPGEDRGRTAARAGRRTIPPGRRAPRPAPRSRRLRRARSPKPSSPIAASCSRRSKMSCSSPIVCPSSTKTSPRV